MDTNSEARLAEIYPPLAVKVRALAVALLAEGITIRVVQGLRTWAEQSALYAKGRNLAGQIVDPKEVVTHARPGSSFHNFGLAVDCAPFDAEGQPDWNASHPAWQRMIAVGESQGLYSGSHFKVIRDGIVHPEPDMPHFQLTGRFPSEPDDEVLYLFKEGGLQAVWNEVDKCSTQSTGRS